MKKYFSYSDEEGFKLFDTKEEAEVDAQGNIDNVRSQLSGEPWPETIGEICYGVITKIAKEKPISTVSGNGFDYYSNYQLEELK